MGKLSYGVKYQLWKPEATSHSSYPASFKGVVLTLLMARNREGTLLYYLCS